MYKVLRNKIYLDHGDLEDELNRMEKEGFKFVYCLPEEGDRIYHIDHDKLLHLRDKSYGKNSTKSVCDGFDKDKKSLTNDLKSVSCKDCIRCTMDIPR